MESFSSKRISFQMLLPLLRLYLILHHHHHILFAKKAGGLPEKPT